MSQKARYVLPLSNDYNNTRMCIPYPDDVNHRAALWGQLHALESARVWQDDPDHKALDAALYWQSVVQDITVSDDCDPFSCPNGITIEIDPDDIDNTSVTAYDVLSFNCGDGNADILFFRCYQQFLGTAHVGMRVRKDGLTVGGTIPHLRVMTFEDSAVDFITVHWLDCLDNTHVQSTGTGSDQIDVYDFQAKRFEIDTLSSFMAVVTLPHEVECTPA